MISCPHCKKQLIDEAKFCGYCGTGIFQKGSNDSISSGKAQTDRSHVDGVNHRSRIRPWVRYWARSLDYILFGYMFAILAAFSFPIILDLPGIAFSVVIVFIWMFAEALLLLTWGTTPGKWLFRITVKHGNSKKLTYGIALERCFKVWLFGVGAGIPLISLAANIMAYTRLKSKGSTKWDSEGEFVVMHKKIGIIRIVAFIIFFLFNLILLSVFNSE